MKAEEKTPLEREAEEVSLEAKAQDEKNDKRSGDIAKELEEEELNEAADKVEKDLLE